MIRKKKETKTVNIIEAEQGKSYLQLVWRRFKKSKMGLLGGIIIVILAILSKIGRAHV